MGRRLSLERSAVGDAVLLQVLRGLTVIALVGAVGFVVTEGVTLASGLAVALGLCQAGALVLARRGHPTAAGRIVVLAWLTVMSTLELVQAGVGSGAAAGHLIVIAIAAVALGRREMFVAGALAVVVHVVAYLLERSDPIGGDDRPFQPAEDLVGQIVLVAALLAVFTLYFREVDRIGRRERTAGAAVERERRFYESILGATGALVSVRGADNADVRYVSPAWVAATGDDLEATRRKLAAEPFAFLHPDDHPPVDAPYSRLLDSDGEDVVVRFATRDGWRWHQFRADPLELDDGDADRIVLTSIDVTKRVEAERRVQAIMDGSPVLMGLRDLSRPDAPYVYINQHWCDVVGLDADEIAAAAVEQRLVHPDDRGQVRQAVAGQVDDVLEVRYETTTGWRWFAFRGAVFLGDAHTDEPTPYAIVVGTDIHARRLAENALATERDELERVNADLERANDDLEQFAHIVSHDLREPLRTITSFTDILRGSLPDELDDEAEQSLTFIEQGAERMRALVGGLLEYSRLGARADHRAVDLRVLVDGIVEDLDRLIAETEAEVTIDDLPVVVGDPAGLRLVFQNLLANALKFRAVDRRPSIAVRAESGPGVWRFTVSDNGIGIEPRQFDRIFELFRRLHTREQYEGTGIGLAHCRRVIGHHGGQIGVESTPDEGSTFWFTLPHDEDGR